MTHSVEAFAETAICASEIISLPMSSGAAGCHFWNKEDMAGAGSAPADPATVLPLCAVARTFCLGKRADLIAAHHQPNPVLQLLELAAIDGDGLFADAEQPSI